MVPMEPSSVRPRVSVAGCHCFWAGCREVVSEPNSALHQSKFLSLLYHAVVHSDSSPPPYFLPAEDESHVETKILCDCLNSQLSRPALVMGERVGQVPSVVLFHCERRGGTPRYAGWMEYTRASEYWIDFVVFSDDCEPRAHLSADF